MGGMGEMRCPGSWEGKVSTGKVGEAEGKAGEEEVESIEWSVRDLVE